MTSPTLARPAVAAGPEPDAVAHAMAHPRPVQGCPWCVQPQACQLCGQTPDVCPDWVRHGEQHRRHPTTIRRAAA